MYLEIMVTFRKEDITIYLKIILIEFTPGRIRIVAFITDPELKETV